MKRFFLPILISIIAGAGIYLFIRPSNKLLLLERGVAIDSLDHVSVYYNGKISHVENRNVTKDGYNLGKRWQCVEFVKRYYLEALNHKMPNTYGHAKAFFDSSVKDGRINKDRNLLQYTNPSNYKPKRGEIIVFAGNDWNKYGHVAIISKVMTNEIEIIQQNAGIFGKSRDKFPLEEKDGMWKIKGKTILGRLGKQ